MQVDIEEWINGEFEEYIEDEDIESNDYAIFTKLKNVEKHSRADRLQTAVAAGYRVVVGLDATEGDIGIVIPEERQVSMSLASHANLYERCPATREKHGGYLDLHGRVKTIRLRGEESRGLWVAGRTLATVRKYDYTKLTPEQRKQVKKYTDETWAPQLPGSFSTIKLGQPIDSWEGVPICRKYYTNKTREKVEHGIQNPENKPVIQDIPVHYKTTHLRERINKLPVGEILVTLKLHGTSGRTGRCIKRRPDLRWYHKAWNRVMPKSWSIGDEDCVVTGSRTVMVNTSKNNYRTKIHNTIARLGLDLNETWYYEIVGYDNNAPIMGAVSLKKLDKADKKEAAKITGNTDHAVFNYGCKPGQATAYVYRIVRNGRDLTYDEIVERLTELCSPYYAVPLVARLSSLTLAEADSLTRNVSVDEMPIERNCIREGVVVHVEKDGERITRGMKHKGYLFCCIEGAQANDKNFVDVEVAG